MRTTPCCKAMCWKCTSRTAWPAWPSATWAAAASTTKTCAARARTRSRSARSTIDKAAEYSCEDSRPDAGRAPGAVAAAAGRRQAALHLRAGDASSEALYRIERNGVLIDAPTLARAKPRTGRSASWQLEHEAYELAGQPFNLGQPEADRRDLLHQAGPAGGQENAERRAAAPTRRCWKNWPRTTRCRPRSWSTAACPSSRAPTPTSWRSWRIRARGRVHTHYAQAVAVTGRLSSNDPNLQNIPIRTPEGRRVREAFVAPAGQRDRQRRLLADRAAHHGPHQRRRVAAARLHRGHGRAPRDRRRGVRRGAGPGVSSEQRRYAKVINFGLIYGMSSFGLARNLGIETKAAAELHRALFPALSRREALHGRDQARCAKSKGYVETVFGRRLYLPEINSPQRPAPQRRRARGHQRADAGHGGRPDQAQHGQGAGGARRRTARARR